MKQPYTDLKGIEKYFNALYGKNSLEQKDRYNRLFEKFKKEFGKDSAYIASSSGRVEVCGNHTDHNGGKVVSCAISLDTLACFLPTTDNIITIKSEGYSDIKINIYGKPNEKPETSSALVRGVVEGFKNKGYNVGGFVALITSNVLGGAGISSSASFEVLISEILNFLYNEGNISNQEKAIISQYSEREFFGKPCGLLDQTAIAFGGLKMLDFSDKTQINVKNIDNDLKDYTFVLINTGGSHANLTDEYASIPNEMFSVARALGKERLIDMTKKEFLDKLPSVIDGLSDRAVNRAMHFYNENDRVERLFNALNNNDYDTFLACINESGISSLGFLQNCYVAGQKEQQIPKAIAISSSFIKKGAIRVHGGGFAGTILNIVKNTELQDYVLNMQKFYENKDIIPLKLRLLGTTVL